MSDKVPVLAVAGDQLQSAGGMIAFMCGKIGPSYFGQVWRNFHSVAKSPLLISATRC